MPLTYGPQNKRTVRYHIKISGTVVVTVNSVYCVNSCVVVVTKAGMKNLGKIQLRIVVCC